MPYTLRLATPATRDLVVEALKGAADQRTRVALGAARKVAEAKAAGSDVRSRAVKVTALLAEAGDLSALATELANAPEVPIVATYPTPVVITREQAGEALDVAPAEEPDEEEGTGLSARAEALAALAGLTDAIVDPDAPDVDTHAIAEDEPADDDVAEVLA